MNLEELDSLTLGFDFLEHFLINNILKVCGPVIVTFLLARGGGRLYNHTIKKNLNDNEKILMCEKHQVLKARVDAGFGSRINVCACMS